jgi:hypothetical protein
LSIDHIEVLTLLGHHLSASMAELVTVYLVALRVRTLAYIGISEDYRTLENPCFLFYATVPLHLGLIRSLPNKITSPFLTISL